MSLDYSEFHLCESFESVQGEGSFVGSPALFIRLLGCNKLCKFCDEPNHRNKSEIEKSGFAKDVFHYLAIKHAEFLSLRSLVVITGGEPTLYELNSLIGELRFKTDAYVSVESNGYNPTAATQAQLYTYSPKGCDLKLEKFIPLVGAACREGGWLFDRVRQKTRTDIKLLFREGEEKETLARLNALRQEFEKMYRNLSGENPSSYINVYLSAINEADTINNENNRALAKFMLAPEFRETDGSILGVKMNVQLHKFLNIK